MKYFLSILFLLAACAGYGQEVLTIEQYKDTVDANVRSATAPQSITKGIIANLYDYLADIVDSNDNKQELVKDSLRDEIAGVPVLDSNRFLKVTDTSRSGIVTTYPYVDSLNARNIKYADTVALIATQHDLNTAIAGIVTDIENEHDSLVSYSDSGSIFVTPTTLADSTDALRGLIPEVASYPKWTDTLTAGKLTTKSYEEYRDTNNLHLNVAGPEYHKWVQAAIIYPVRDTNTNTNTWHLLTTGGHSPINVDSVSSTTSNITIYYTATANEVKTMLVSRDESNIGAQQGVYKSTYPYYTGGGFSVGHSAGFSSASFNMTKPGCICGTLTYDSVNNTFNHQLVSYNSSIASKNSLKFNVTWNAGSKYLDIKTGSVIYIKGEPRVQIISDNNARHALLVKTEPILANSWVRVKFWTPAVGGGFELAALPHNAIISYNFGPIEVTVNPQTEIFGPNSNFFIFGLMSGEYDYNH